MNKYIINRPVNSLRKVYEPAFLGAKIQATESTALQAKILEGSIRKKLNSSENWSYKDITVFKGCNIEGKKEYRKCLAPSPSTSAAEAFLLNDLSEIKDEIRIKNVYSYRLAEKGASSNYVYFLTQYIQRNNDILSALEDDPAKLVAVCYDIRSFYPSVDTSTLQKKLFEFHQRFKSTKDLSLLVDFASHQLGKSFSGIPVGTEMSHQLADIYLHDFDNELAKLFSSRYFRYVDDITIICDRSRVDETNSIIKEKIEALGLQLNDDKFLVIDAKTWNREIENAAVDGEDFFQYCQDLNSWINHSDGNLKEIKRHLKDEGFNIPLEKIAVRKSYSLIDKAADLSPREILLKTHNLKRKYQLAAESMTSISPSQHSKGTLQKARRALNPLFYLLPLSEYNLIEEVAKTHQNLITQKMVSLAFTSGDTKALFEFPGSTVSSYCEIWKTLGHDNKFDVFNIDFAHIKPYEIDAITTFSLHGIIKSEQDLANIDLLRFLRPGVISRTRGLSRFDSEIETLRIRLSQSAQDNLLGRREDQGEELNMQALDLGDQVISG
jgi:hypothetical protein